MGLMLDYNFNLELTQLSGQTSQPPWTCEDNTFREVVLVDGKPVLFKVSDDSFSYEMPLNADFSVNEKTVFKKFHDIYDLDFDLEKFYSYLENDEKLKNAKDFLLDSGAFSFMNGRKSVDWDEYLERYAYFIASNDIRNFF